MGVNTGTSVERPALHSPKRPAPLHTHMDTAATALALVILTLLVAIGSTALYAIGSAPRLGGEGDPRRARRPLVAKKAD
jgi:hypothetical protein